MFIKFLLCARQYLDAEDTVIHMGKKGKSIFECILVLFALSLLLKISYHFDFEIFVLPTQ
jgi:hypothetical protein